MSAVKIVEVKPADRQVLVKWLHRPKVTTH